jgi:DNA processing protein
MVTEGLYATASHVRHPEGIRAIARESADYPRMLSALSNPPAVLYVAGDLSPLDDGAIAVVGSRRATPEATEAARALGRAIADHGRTVVSGLARGIDAAAHQGALSAPGGRAIAVVATGLDLTYPPEHLELDLSIRRRGAVVSPFPFGQSALRSSFLARNELIAGLAVGSLIVVADARSGTRSEIEHTLAQRKPVFFWTPLMHDAPWASALVNDGVAYFVDDVEAILERLPTPS